MWRLRSLLPSTISILTGDQAKHANVVVNQMSNHTCFQVSFLFCPENNKDGGTVVSSVCKVFLQGKHTFVAEELSWRCFTPPLTQLIPCNFEERELRIPSFKTAGETKT